ncbi:hypothetical protein O1611_g2145 [Lasiodiplodia mahajangana]|uniref:Uncharacterized protein n=1 Tax=Lasiodiplodia mahajangana TaxID=1108764 RepID=A0ACC2JVV7_9PEZI|nr:hypothetical protein O1611_g2145 [Lasiodiplodia mahajangana]
MLGGPEKVTLTAWVEALHETVSQTNDLERNPAVKLVDFFDNLASDSESMRSIELSTVNASSLSMTLGSLESVKAEWLSNWIRQWEL